MPFAAHLAALNLTLQAPLHRTNETRVGIGNSVNLKPHSDVGALGSLQYALLAEPGSHLKRAGLQEERGSFQVEPADLVIMNPPFTRKERLTREMQGTLAEKFCGQNYWAYFLAIADRFLKAGGRIAAVLPRDFLAGSHSFAVRKWLFAERKYSLLFLVKSTQETAFSENARFRDFLVVLEKVAGESPCAVVYLKRNQSQMAPDEASEIGAELRRTRPGRPVETTDYAIRWESQNAIRTRYRNLWWLASFSHPRYADSILGLYEEVLARSGRKLTTVELSPIRKRILRGLEPTPPGMLNAVFAVRPIEPDRVQNSRLILDRMDRSGAHVTVKGFNRSYFVPGSVCRPGLKTCSYLEAIDGEGQYDAFIEGNFDRFEEMRHFLDAPRVDFERLRKRAEARRAHLVFFRRINLAAPGTKIAAVHSELGVVPGKAFWAIKVDPETAKVLSLWLNSTLGIVECLLWRTETEGGYCEITEDGFSNFHVPVLGNFTREERAQLRKLFRHLGRTKLPRLTEQFESRNWARELLDITIMRTLGFKPREARRLLHPAYEAIANELIALSAAMRGQSLSENE